MKTFQPNSARSNIKTKASKPSRPEINLLQPTVMIQQAIGNQALLRMFGSYVQPKLKVGAPGDKYEREADLVAGRIMTMPAPELQEQPEEEEDKIRTSPTESALASNIQKLSAAQEEDELHGSFLQRENEQEDEETGLLQRSETGEQAQSVNPEIERNIDNFHGGGAPLPESSRAFFEPRFGYDFSRVRIHNGSAATETAEAINARAFTLGNDIVFGAGQYTPEQESGQKLLAHELTHVIQQNGIISRWSGHEHSGFGEVASKRVKNNLDKFKVTIPDEQDSSLNPTEEGRESSGREITPSILGESGVEVSHKPEPKVIVSMGTPVVIPGGPKKHMTLGQANELAGDYTASPSELSKLRSANPGSVAWTHYVNLASTNINHFFPLAHREWQIQHRRALGLAVTANMAYRDGDKSEGDRAAELAIQTEAFGLHFLQDSYASGHQYPRAFEMAAASWVRTAIRGYYDAKTYHDILCALPDGLDMAVGRKFHGDETADIEGQDKKVADETYNSIAEVLCAISGTKPGEVDAKPPTVNPGPDVAKIMKDPEAGPIWYSLEHSLSDLLSTARNNEDGTVTTDSGITYNVSDILTIWDNRKGGDAPELTSEPDLKTRLVDSALKGQTRMVDTESDDSIIDLLKNEDGVLDVNMVPRNLTEGQVVLVCRALISGACIGLDEHAVLFILRSQSHEVFRKAVEKLTPQYIDSGLDWAEWDAFSLACAHRYPAGSNLGAKIISQEENDDAGRMLINGSHGEPPIPKGNLSGMEWIGVIEALLSGDCGDADEDAIIDIVKYMADSNQADLIHLLIGPSKMDRGVDGKQWDKICAIMRQAGYHWSWWG